MQGIIFDIKHCAIHDGPGLRTTVFFKGCPLNCWWCHNPESILPIVQKIETSKRIGEKTFHEQSDVGYFVDCEAVMKEIEKDIIFFDESNGGVTFSGGEPLMQVHYLIELAKMCKQKGIHTALDTSGYASVKNFRSIIPYIDLFLFDIKTLDDNLHMYYTGVSNKVILENLNYLLIHNKQVIIRYPLIPGINTAFDQISDLKEYLSARVKEIHFLPYHTIAKNKYKQLGQEYKLNGIEALTDSFLNELKKEFEQNDFTVKIGG